MKSQIEDLFNSMLTIASIKGVQREYKFHPERKWRFDFAIPERKIAVEIEGGIWVQGRHNSGAGMEKDMEKYNAAVDLGWKLYRFSSGHVKSGYAIETIARAYACQ